MKRWLRLKRAGVRRPQLVISEARRAGLRLDRALAMLENETGIPQRNIFGCDHGPNNAFCHQRVTKDRVRALLRSTQANGVGWTQLTYKPFVIAAEKAGGAHLPRYQMRVGFKVLADLIRANGEQAGFARYNGSGDAAEEYGRRAVANARKWRKIIDG